MSATDPIRGEFERRFGEWQNTVRRLSEGWKTGSWLDDYIDNDAYRAIVALGRPALPLVMEKLREGEFFLNEAAFRIAGISIVDVSQQPSRIVSEQELSRLILEWWERVGRSRP